MDIVTRSKETVQTLISLLAVNDDYKIHRKLTCIDAVSAIYKENFQKVATLFQNII